MAQDSSSQHDGGLTPEQLRDYATTLARIWIEDIERRAVISLASVYCPGGTISDADAHAVCALLDAATVTLTFPGPGEPPVGHSSDG